MCIIQSVLRLPGQHHFHICRFQILFQFLGNLKVDILFRCPIDADLPRIVSSVSGINDHTESPGVISPHSRLPQSIYRMHRTNIFCCFPAGQCHRQNQKTCHDQFQCLLFHFFSRLIVFYMILYAFSAGNIFPMKNLPKLRNPFVLTYCILLPVQRIIDT